MPHHLFFNLPRLNLGFKSYEELFPADELAEHTGQMIPNALELGKIDGQMYGLAFTFSTPILYINKGLFEQAGLDTTNLPKTWDDVYKAAVQIKEKTAAKSMTCCYSTLPRFP